jgi:hypothetical protein
MFGFLNEIFQPVNLPATGLLLLVAGYWLLVIFGAFGSDAFDVDLGADVDGIDVDTGGDLQVGDLADHGLFVTALEFFYLGTVPLTVLVSVFALLFWVFTVTANHYWNSEWSWLVELWLLGPCLIVSLFTTRLVLMPTIPFFSKMNAKDEETGSSSLVGQQAMVSTSEVTDSFGQAEIAQDGPPIVLNVRCYGARLQKGDVVDLVSYDPTTHSYLVRLSKN